MTIEYIDRTKCTNCSVCYHTCPMDVFRQMGLITHIAYPEDCMSCHLCEDCCKPGAIYVSARQAREMPSPY